MCVQQAACIWWRTHLMLSLQRAYCVCCKLLVGANKNANHAQLVRVLCWEDVEAVRLDENVSLPHQVVSSPSIPQHPCLYAITGEIQLNCSVEVPSSLLLGQSIAWLVRWQGPVVHERYYLCHSGHKHLNGP